MFLFAVNKSIIMQPDKILRKGSGTLFETLVMVEGYQAYEVYPNEPQCKLNKLSVEGHVLHSEIYVNRHVKL